MAKQHNTGTQPTAAAGSLDVPVVESTDSLPVTKHEQIAQLAYTNWEQRGRPDGSPEQDWFKAEAELQENVSAAVA